MSLRRWLAFKLLGVNPKWLRHNLREARDCVEMDAAINDREYDAYFERAEFRIERAADQLGWELGGDES